MDNNFWTTTGYDTIRPCKGTSLLLSHKGSSTSSAPVNMPRFRKSPSFQSALEIPASSNNAQIEVNGRSQVVHCLSGQNIVDSPTLIGSPARRMKWGAHSDAGTHSDTGTHSDAGCHLRGPFAFPFSVPAQYLLTGCDKEYIAAIQNGGGGGFPQTSGTAFRPLELHYRQTHGKESYSPWPTSSMLSNTGVPQPRVPIKRAVVIGINYRHRREIALRGTCNDAHLFALALINLMEFDCRNIVLLTDTLPSSCYRSGGKSPRKKGKIETVLSLGASFDCTTESDNGRPNSPQFTDQPDRDRLPTRHNIMTALKWLVKDSIPGDVIVFYYAGHGVQVDDRSGWEGEGYHEAIVPLDNDPTGDPNPITTLQLKEILLSVDEQAQVTLILDCNGGQTMLDPAGTGNWFYIKGVKQKGFWPFITDPTNKVNRAKYDSRIWKDEAMYRKFARPRFLPGIDIASTSELATPSQQKFAHPPLKAKAFLLAAAPWGQCAVEAIFPSVGLRTIGPGGTCSDPVTMTGKKIIHGVFTWCLVQALQDMMIRSVERYGKKHVTFKRLIAETQDRLQRVKRFGDLRMLDQVPELTFYQGGGASPSESVMWPLGGSTRTIPFSFCPPSLQNFEPIPNQSDFFSPMEADEEMRREAAHRRNLMTRH